MSQVYADFAQSPWQNHAHYPHYFSPPPDARHPAPGLSLNLSCLTVASPTNLSPINPPAPSLMSPASPTSPATNPFTQQHATIQSPFQFDPHQGSSGQQSPSTHYDDQALAPPGSAAGSYDRRAVSRSSSSSAASSQLPRKRSFPSNASSTSLSTTLVEESPYDESREAAMDLGSYDDLDMRTAYGSSTNGGGSPVDGSGNNSGAEDALNSAGSGQLSMALGGVGGSMNVLGKPMATNNFVTKLYQMINDSKSAHFIAWTELGTSFVVSNVGEFSRSILGSHFKHNNFSSFVRQLNMYGFHKINRTPRAQRTSTDAQTWEFSHHKFLRGRPDLLDEIKRKALEPDPAIKHRVELPGEVAAQLTAMRDENRRMHDQLTTERQRVDKLVGVVGRLWDVMSKSFPSSVGQFPPDLLESENPNIYITSPTAMTSRYPPPLSMNLNNPSLHTMHSLNSPNSSPTAADFPSQLQQQHHAQQQQHPLSRQHSFQHPSYSREQNNGTSTSTPLPGSPGSVHMDLFDDVCDTGRAGNSLKRPRLDPSTSVASSNNNGDSLHLMSTMSSPGTATAPGMSVSKKSVSRARSDSAPLGYGNGHGHMVNGGWGNGMGVHGNVGGVGGRPRSGSGMGPRIPNIGNLARNAVSTPLLSITTIPQ